MPYIQVNMLDNRTDEQKRAMLLAVTEAVRTSLDIPVDRVRVWIAEFPATDVAVGGQIPADRIRGS
jgi:4-oxalocrotonate tautomerase